MNFKRIVIGICCLLCLVGCVGCDNNSVHEHSFSSEWHTDENSHWHNATCEHSEVIKDFGTHIDLNNDAKCDICEYQILPNNYTLVFVSDYCTLSGETEYPAGSELELTLRVKDEYADYYVVPDDIYVLIGDKEGVNGEDYSYTKTTADKKTTATISLTMTNNTVLTAKREDSNNQFRVGQTSFNRAIIFENEQYIQIDQIKAYYSNDMNIMSECIAYFSPTINFTDLINFEIRHRTEELTYQQKQDDKIIVYTYDINNREWVQSEDSLQNYFTNQNLPVNAVLESLGISYNDLDGHFDEIKNIYSLKKEIDGHSYDITLCFENDKLKQFTYLKYDDIYSFGEYGYSSFTYYEETPELPNINK